MWNKVHVQILSLFIFHNVYLKHVTSIIVLRHNLEIALKAGNKMNVETTKPFLLYAYIVPFLFWTFDVITTLYAIDYLGVAGEMNPLGWPLGALGALIFYIPALIFTHLLLFRIQNRYSPWVAVLITVLALGIGYMNLLAGLHNIDVAVTYAGRDPLFSGFAEFFSNIIVQILLWVMILVLIVLGAKEITSRPSKNRAF